MLLPVDDDGRDLLVEEDKDGRQHSGDDCERYQPHMCHRERVDEPVSVVSRRLKAWIIKSCYRW